MEKIRKKTAILLSISVFTVALRLHNANAISFSGFNSDTPSSSSTVTPPPTVAPPPPTPSDTPPPATTYTPPPMVSPSTTFTPSVSVSGASSSLGLPPWLTSGNSSLSTISGKLRDCTPSADSFLSSLSLDFLGKLFDIDFDFVYFYCKVVNEMANKLKGLLPNPEFNLEVPTVLKVGKNGKIKIDNPVNSYLSESNVAGQSSVIPTGLEKDCIEDGKETGKCSQIVSRIKSGKTEEIYGETVGNAIFSQKTEDLKEYAKNMTKAIATTSNVEFLNETSTQGAIALRTGLMNQATGTTKTLTAGKEIINKVPAPLRSKYKAVATKQFLGKTYIQSLQRRLDIHYQQVANLQALVDETCKLPTETEKPSPLDISGFKDTISGIGSAISSFISYVPGTPGTSSPKVTPVNIEKALKKEKDIKEEFEGKQVTLIGKRGLLDWSKLTDVVGKVIATYMEIQTINISKMLTSGFGDGFGAIGELQAESDDQTRDILHKENMQTRNLMKAYNCANLRIQLERAMIDIDQLETQIATLSATMAQNQEKEIDGYSKENAKWMMRGQDR